MTKTTFAAVSAALLLTACVKEVTSDERLERETERVDALKTSSGEELSKLRCDAAQTELGKARDDRTSEEQRLTIYVDVYLQNKTRAAKFEEAMARNPDLAYQEGAHELVAAREACVQGTADVRNELESLVREIIKVPLVDEVKRGATVKVARTNFATLRNAIEKLDLDDREALFQKLDDVEKQVDGKGKK